VTQRERRTTRADDVTPGKGSSALWALLRRAIPGRTREYDVAARLRDPDPWWITRKPVVTCQGPEEVPQVSVPGVFVGWGILVALLACLIAAVVWHENSNRRRAEHRTKMDDIRQLAEEE